MADASDAVIEAIYAASLDPAGWQEAVDGVAGVFHTATGALYVNRDGPNGLEVGVLAAFGHDDRAIVEYLDYYGSINPFDVNLGRSAIGDVVTETELDRRLRARGTFETSEYFNDWVRPQHLRHVIGCYVDRTDGGTLCASFYRPTDGAFYSQGEVELFARLMRHTTRAIEIGVRLRTAEAEMETTLARGGTVVITLGRDGRVRQRSALADVLLAAGCGLSERNGRLRTAMGEDQPMLDRLVACAFDPKRFAWAENARLPIRRADGGPPLTVRITASRGFAGAFAPDRAASAILTVEGFQAEADQTAARLRRRFGLTVAQGRLALALRSGRSLAEVAKATGVSHETLRTHLKALFQRTGTHRQVELVLLLQREVRG